ncbi:MAG: TraR/DksA family transcriptional regulator, partial [Actinomycetota bacterium]|nr:TraR/DksA family transcriptional regulator [Actinomycetota bacterium]
PPAPPRRGAEPLPAEPPSRREPFSPSQAPVPTVPEARPRAPVALPRAPEVSDNAPGRPPPERPRSRLRLRLPFRRGERSQLDQPVEPRIEEGSFGTCARCGNPIGEARLEAMPYATLCIDCKRLEETVEPVELQADEVAPPLPAAARAGHGGQSSEPARTAGAFETTDRAERRAEHVRSPDEREARPPAEAEPSGSTPEPEQEREPAGTDLEPAGEAREDVEGERVSEARAREAPAPEPSGEPPPSRERPREELPPREEEPSLPPSPERPGEELPPREEEPHAPPEVQPPRLAPLPAPADDSEAARESSPVTSRVVRLDDRRGGARQWNVWELERIAREEARRAPDGAENLSYLLLHLRRFATPGGDLPRDFDGLVRESFGPLLARLDRA